MMHEDTHLFQGMRRDNHPIRQGSNFLWDAKNIRFTAIKEDTSLSITNERGTSDILNSFTGKYLGHCTIGEYLIVFTYNRQDNQNRIYRVHKQSLQPEVLFSGELNMYTPIQTLGVYESSIIQKVYWVDGRNSPRVINIVKDLLTESSVSQAYSSDLNQFNFIQNMSLNERVIIKRKEGSGSFASGTIQYCFNYYNKYGQESNIFYTSELQYTSPVNRGGSPEESVSNVFSIRVENVDRKFQYMRIYSIHRTSIDSVPTVKIITDIPITSDVLTYIDTGTIGDIIDPSRLLYIGGEDIIAHTISEKDNTLFLGNIEINRPNISKELKDLGIFSLGTASSSLRQLKLGEHTNPKALYINSHQMVVGNTSSFKSNDKYRVGIQFQYKNGKWSEPLFIQDVTIKHKPNLLNDSQGQVLQLPQITIRIPSEVSQAAKSLGYVRVRPLIVYPQLQDREVLAQGMVCPTVFNVGGRKNNSPFSQSSWFIRPNLPVDISEIDNAEQVDKGAFVEFRHLQGLFYGNNRGAEIQGAFPVTLAGINSEYRLGNDNSNSGYMVDQSILTMHSPDIEFDDSTQQALDGTDLKFRIVGLINFTANSGDINIQTSTPPANSAAQGFYHRPITAISEGDNYTLAARSLVSGMFYRDSIIDDLDDNASQYIVYPKDRTFSYMVYPWHRSGSLNNDTNRPQDKGTRTAVLSKKKISNLKFSSQNTWLSTPFNLESGISPVSIFNSNEVSMVKIPTQVGSGISSITYYGNIDTIITHKNKYSSIVTDSSDDQFLAEGVPIGQLLTSVGDGDLSLKETSEPIRLKYKSTPHAVFALNNSISNVWNNPTCLPSVNNLNRVSTNVVPFWTEQVQVGDNPLKDYTIKKCHYGMDRGLGSTKPNDNYPLVASYPEYTGENGVYCLCKWVDGQGWVVDEALMQEELIANNNSGNKILFRPVEESYSSLYFNVTYLGNGPIVKKVQINESVDNLEYKITQGNINVYAPCPYLFLAELYRDSPDNQFGGDTQEALRNNLWFPAGDSCKIGDSEVYIYATYGDTWYQRYDCLKTYPFTQEDENSVIEIASFMCETRTNIDGRYDRNRGQTSNMYMTPQNFNLLNKVYTQKNNFFNYRMLDEDYYKIRKFPNQVIWSTQKSSFEEIDSWTSINPSSSIDLDGSNGTIQALTVFNDNLFCFQDQCLNQLLFNSRVQIPTSDGVPIEISNNYKMEGSRVIASQIGCQDKFSTVTTPNGIYFIDSINKSIYLFNGKIVDLSQTCGMSIWARENCITEQWEFGYYGMRLCYDPKLKDIYFIPGTKDRVALCYSESLGQFISTYDYGGSVLFSLGGDMYAMYSNTDTSLYKLFESPFTNIFGKERSYYISFISNDNPTATKIFDTLDFRADIEYSTLNKPFSYIRVENEYQDTGNIQFTDINLRKKFRVWRALIPRDNKVRDGIRFKYGLSRIRNPWVKITLGNNSIGKMTFHDISVKYTI